MGSKPQDRLKISVSFFGGGTTTTKCESEEDKESIAKAPSALDKIQRRDSLSCRTNKLAKSLPQQCKFHHPDNIVIIYVAQWMSNAQRQKQSKQAEEREKKRLKTDLCVSKTIGAQQKAPMKVKVTSRFLGPFRGSNRKKKALQCLPRRCYPFLLIFVLCCCFFFGRKESFALPCCASWLFKRNNEIFTFQHNRALRLIVNATVTYETAFPGPHCASGVHSGRR